MEVCVVDDGSTNNSSKIVDEYRKTDNRVRCIEKENQGLSVSRNADLNVALGDSSYLLIAMTGFDQILLLIIGDVLPRPIQMS